MTRPAWKDIDETLLEQAGVDVATNGAVVIPYRRPDGTVHRIRQVAPCGRCWWGPGNDLVPFGLETLPHARVAGDAVLFVAEGESDALALRQHAAGIVYPDGRVVDTYVLGLPGALSWRSAWIEHLEPFAVVYVVGDGDRAGRAMNARMRADFPRARPLALPDGQDVRAILQRPGGRDQLGRLIDRADLDARLLAAFLDFDRLEDAEAWLAGRSEKTRRAA